MVVGRKPLYHGKPLASLWLIALVFGLCAVVSGIARFAVRLWHSVNAGTIVR